MGTGYQIFLDCERKLIISSFINQKPLNTFFQKTHLPLALLGVSQLDLNLTLKVQ